MTASRNDVPPLLHDCQDVADRLGVGLDWVRRKVQKREIPHVRLGRLVKFTDAHVNAIIAQHTLEAQVRTPGRRRSVL